MLEDWYEIRGLQGTRELWVFPTGEGDPIVDPWLTSDGRDIHDLIVYGDFDQVPVSFWFERNKDSRSEQKADVLWCSGFPAKLVTRRFIDALVELGVSGFRALPVEVRTKRWGTMTDEYLLFIEDLSGTEEVRGHPGRDDPVTSMVVSPRVAKALKAKKLRLKLDKYDPWESWDFSPKPLPE